MAARRVRGFSIGSLKPLIRLSSLADLSPKTGRGEESTYFFNTRTGLPASQPLMSSTICV